MENPLSASHAVVNVRRAIVRLQKIIGELEAFDTATMTTIHPPEISGLQSAIKAALARAFGPDTPEYRTFKDAGTIHWLPTIRNREADTESKQRTAENIAHSLATLRVCPGSLPDAA